LHHRCTNILCRPVPGSPGNLCARANHEEIGLTMPEIVRIEKLQKSFAGLEVLKDIDLQVQPGETMVLLGSSGSGKSTLLRCMNFMEIPTKGRIYLGGNLIGNELRGVMRYREAELCKLRARIGMVFQHFNLFPHMTVLQNVVKGQTTVLKRSLAEAEAK